MTFFEALILGVVEGITEFLPISSTAHMVIVSRLLGIPESDFLSTFIIAIQLGAIGSIIYLYTHRVLTDWQTFKRIVVAFIPTALIGFFLYSLLKDVLIESLPIIAWALILGGFVLIAFEMWQGERARISSLQEMPYTTAILIGIAQAIAIIPGVSRAGATILGGMALGLSRKDIVEFSFLLAVPTMLSATAYDLLKTSASFESREWYLLAVGFVAAFISALIAVQALLKYVSAHSFTAFGYYRIIVGVLILIAVYLA